MKNRNSNIWALWGRYSTAALLLPSAMFVGYLLGYFLDKLFETTWLKVVFLFLGIIAGFIEMLRELSKTNGR